MSTKILETQDHTRQCAIWTARLLLAAVQHSGRGTAALKRIDSDTRRLLGLPEKTVAPSVMVTLLNKVLVNLNPEQPAQVGALFANVALLGDALGLSQVERDLLALTVMMATTEGVREALEQVQPLPWSHASAILAVALSAPVADVRAALRPSAPLGVTRLVKRGRGHRHEGVIALMEDFADAMLEDHTEVDTLVAHLFSPAQPPTLALSDFPHISEDLALLLPMLRAACSERTVGFDALVWGPPGTGKTELARVIAQEIGARLYEVNVADDDGDSLKGVRRVEAWTLSQRMLGHKPASLVLFDEAEDVFPRGGGFAEMFGIEPETSISKGWMNKALETHAVPTIWISNSISQIDPAYLRRFDVVVELRPPPALIRRGILQRHLAQLPVGSVWLDRMASDDRLVPAHIERAARAVQMAAPTGQAATESALDRLLEPQLDRVGARRNTAAMACGAYDPSLVNASHDVQALAAALACRPRGTLCLYGPSGTGKTAFVQHLSALTGLPLLQKRASDLLGKYVGENEKNIAAMFRQARDEGKMLFLDEADSFFQDRTNAHRQWEVSLVNELLVQMEGFEGLFVCATNLVESLDRASLRRFFLKIRFDTLQAAQRWHMLGQTLLQLGGDAPEATLRLKLDRLDGLTAGDFAAVARQSAMLGAVATAEGLVAALQEELTLKGGAARKAAGFW